MRNIKTLLAALLLFSCTPKEEITSYTDYVDPKIGSGGHGHVFVGANVPFGMVQLGPTSIPQEWDWCSGYHASDSTLIGFSHTHLSGTGIGDLFDITIMPVVKANAYGTYLNHRLDILNEFDQKVFQAYKENNLSNITKPTCH
mgnify:CR=1 FL=1